MIKNIGISNIFENWSISQAGVLSNPSTTLDRFGRFSFEFEQAPDMTTPKLHQKDPFAPAGINSGSNKPVERDSLLDGLVIRDSRRYALIKGKMAGQGDRAFGMRVIMVRNDKVILANEKNIRVLYLFWIDNPVFFDMLNAAA